MSQSDYKVNITVTTTDKTSGPAKQAAKGMANLQTAVKAVGAAFAAVKSAQFVVELVKSGAAVQRQETAFNNLAAAAGTSGDRIIKAIGTASHHTVSRMDAMTAANKALIMDVAKTPEAFERLTKVATALGIAMGQDAAKSIDDFIVAAARQEREIADNLGLVVSVEKANVKYAAALGKTTEQLTDAERKQAFLNEMLEQGEAKMSELGDMTLDNAGKMEQASASWSNAKASVGMMLATLANSTGILDKVALYTQNVTRATEVLNEEGFNLRVWLESVGTYMTTWGSATERSAAALDVYTSKVADANEADKQWVQQQQVLLDSSFGIETQTRAVTAAVDEATRAREAFINSFYGIYEAVVDLTPEIDRYRHSIGQAQEVERYAHTTNLPQLEQSYYKIADGVNRVRYVSEGYAKALQTGVQNNQQITQTIMDTVRALDEESKAALKAGEDMVKASEDAAAARLRLSMDWTRQLDSMAEAQQETAAKREQAEAEHQEKLAKLQERGAARAVQINAAAEQEKLDALQRKMEIALQQQAEFTDKTKQSTLMSKSDQIARIQAEIDEQAQLLSNYHAGRLVKTGENVDALIAEENRRHEAVIAGLDEEMSKQQEIQKQALGNMMLQTFDAWSQQKDIPVEKMLEMRTAIAEEYGLVGEGATELVTDMMDEWERWAEGTKVSTDEVVKYMSAVVDSTGLIKDELLELTAQTWWIRIRYEGVDPRALLPDDRIGGEPRQHGGPVYANRPYLVGEAGPEMFIPSQSGTIVDSHDTYQFYTQPAAAMALTRKRRAHLSRLMG